MFGQSLIIEHYRGSFLKTELSFTHKVTTDIEPIEPLQ